MVKKLFRNVIVGNEREDCHS
uniref:Uncharacterized protein n=1 Tax=Anguilla anguilla TaxID=7936 RepID=A0A0E9TS31_ANGAN